MIICRELSVNFSSQKSFGFPPNVLETSIHLVSCVSRIQVMLLTEIFDC